MKSKIQLLITLFLFTKNLYSQPKGFNNYCDAIKFFLSSQEVVNNFKAENKNDSVIYIVDIKLTLGDCNFTKWRDKDLVIVKDGPLFDSLKSYNLYYTAKGRTNIYLFYMGYNSKTQGNFMIQSGRNNVLSLAEFKKQKNKYYLGQIKNGVE
jgi:hypothetical protein